MVEADYTGARSPEHSSKSTCNTERVGLKKFASVGDEYYLLGDATEGGHLRRSLVDSSSSSSSLGFREGTDAIISPIIIPSNSLDAPRFLEQEADIIYGRECFCAKTDNVYCPVGAPLCRIIAPNSRTYKIQCEGETQGMAQRFLLPLVLFMYILIVCLLFGSPQGRYTRAYLKKILCCWDEERYQEELRKQIRYMAQQAYRQRQRALAAGRNPNRIYNMSAGLDPVLRGAPPRASAEAPVAQRVAVGLKTRLYGTDELVHECTICLADFTQGERVGDLPCGHVFHVEPCLKKWITRNNRCPLCQTVDVAVPREDSTRATTTTEETSDVAPETTTSNDQFEQAEESERHPIADENG